MGADSTRSPQLRIALTAKCNLRCFYCQPGGEGWVAAGDPLLGRGDLRFLLAVASRVGFSHVKLTGGEPFLREDAVEIIADAADCEGIRDVQVVTNGILLERAAPQLAHVGLSLLTVSMDSHDPNRFREMCGGELRDVLRGLHASREYGIRLRINTVVTARNVSDIQGMISLARSYGASLKLLDLFRLGGCLNNGKWRENYIPLSRISGLLERLGGVLVGSEEAPGGVGAPLLDYRLPDGSQIVLNDSMVGGCYHPDCKSCVKYPCQDAMISLRVTHDGYLKRCLVRNDNLVPVGECLRRRDWAGTHAKLSVAFRLLTGSTFVAHAWHPDRIDGAGR